MRYVPEYLRCAFCGAMLARSDEPVMEATDSGREIAYCDALCQRAAADSPESGSLGTYLADWLRTDCYERDPEVDAITLEVMNGALLSICTEMAKTMERTAYSPVFYEGADMTTAIYDADITLLAQYEGIPAQMGSMKFAVEAGIKHLGKENLRPGDAIFFNDSHRGTPHLPEFCMIIPIFWDGEIIAYSANVAHHTDVGGKSPGSMPADATEIFQEGVIIPPVKFIKEGREDPELWEVCLNNVRTPFHSYGDAMAMYASTLIGERRVLELLEKHGADRFERYAVEVRRYAERRMRAGIKEIPNGVYAGEATFDDDGVTDRPTTMRLQLVVLDEDVILDFRGTDPQARGPINSPYGVAYSACSNALFNLVDPHMNHNQGTFSPIHAILPPGSVVNCTHPAPLSAGQSESHNVIVECVLDALAKAVPDRAPAPSGSTSTQLTGGGRDEHGDPYTYIIWEGSGFGGLAEKDGTTAVMAWVGVGSKTFPAEVLETHYPWRVRRRELRPDSGAGRTRGGLGVAMEYEILVDYFHLNSVSSRGRTAPQGRFGGDPGQLTEVRVIRAGVEYLPQELQPNIVCPTRFSGLLLMKGDRVIVRSPGGGGYGPRAERDPDAVRRDLQRGYISLEAAIEVYGLDRDEAQEIHDRYTRATTPAPRVEVAR